MLLGFVSAILPDLSLDEVFSLAAAIGYECVELMCWPRGKAERRYAGVTHIDVQALGDREIAHVHELETRHSVKTSGLGYYPNPLAPDAAEAQVATTHLKRVITAARALGLDTVSSFIGRDWTKSVDANWPRFREVWKDLISFAEDNGIRVAIENCPMLFTADEWPGGKNLASTPAIWRRMFEEIPSASFGLNYDPSHFIWQRMDYIAPLRDFASRIFRIHLKDARMDPYRLDQVGILAYPLEYHQPKLPGLGDVDWGRFFAVLRETGYDGPACVEVEDRAYEADLDARKRALAQSHDYLRQFTGWHSISNRIGKH